ncbi:MAG TPA: biotin--[acetyl-CoA-carboxylase] ligase [Opitutaceae bacterium]|nr:biotin--[acetyl-CoA-carboxylase] ligase [Opitutaceae bacterium]
MPTDARHHSPTALHCDGWHLEVLAVAPSTNSHAARLQPWTAVRAVTQTAGRGRTPDRTWVSDEGGLWLSAVLPCPGERARWAILPLAAGWAVLNALREWGVRDARLRWPNDIMVGRGKLAGLLVERFTADTAVVGIGLNIFNHPERAHPELARAAVRLADLVPGTYSVDDIATTLLRAVRAMHGIILERGFEVIAEELNRQWTGPRPVEVTLATRALPVAGRFEGIDSQGRLRLSTRDGGLSVYDAGQVTLFRELDSRHRNDRPNPITP